VAGLIMDVLLPPQFREAYSDARDCGLTHKEALASLVTVKK